ncbi:MAG: type II CAAX endopeptidase family protein [Armatimonadetes bacterium]|nr:type II CAAX endopeptidase family protein [Armatimonadota bacterium]
MGESVEASAGGAARRGISALSSVGIAVAVAAVIWTGWSHTRTAPHRTEAARLQLEALDRARRGYLAEPGPGPTGAIRTQYLGDAVSSLEQLARLNPSANSIRKLMLMQHMAGDRAWRGTALRLRRHDAQRPLMETDAEIALWAQVLGDEPIPAEGVAAARSLIRTMGLGWFEHVALSRLYQRAGMAQAAAAETNSARFTAVLMSLFDTGVLVALTLGILALAFVMRSWRRPDAEGSAAGFRVPERLSPDAALACRYAFCIYLVGILLMRLASPALSALPHAGSRSEANPITVGLLSTILLALSAAPPVATLLWQGRRAGLRLADFGLTGARPWHDVGLAVTGYLAVFPVLTVTILATSRLLGDDPTPLNPAITAFAGSGNAFIRAMLLCQAVLVAPIVEEFMFRAVLFRGLQGQMRTRWAMLGSAAVFAGLHPQLPAGFPVLFVLACGFSLLYLRSGNLLASVLAHALNNGGVFVYLALVAGT